MSFARMRWTVMALLLIGTNACIRSAERAVSNSGRTVAPKDSTIRAPGLDIGTTPTAAGNRQLPSAPVNPKEAHSWLVNTGACLEPLEPIYQLSDDWTNVRRALNVDGDALVVLVTAPAVRQLHALSLHRRSSGVYFLKVTRLSPSEPLARTRERAIDPKTAKLLLKLWTALTSRIQLVESEEASFDGEAYFFSTGRITGYTANPRRGSVLQRTIFAMDWLTELVEEPTREEASDRNVIQEELRQALARTIADETCTRRIVE